MDQQQQQSGFSWTPAAGDLLSFFLLAIVLGLLLSSDLVFPTDGLTQRFEQAYGQPPADAAAVPIRDLASGDVVGANGG